MPTVSRPSERNFFESLQNISQKEVSCAAALTSIALAALAYCSLKSTSCFRWPVAIAAGAGSAFFLFLGLTLYCTAPRTDETNLPVSPKVQGKKEEEIPPEIEKKSVQKNDGSSSLLSKILDSSSNFLKVQNILQAHGRYSFAPEEISEYAKEMPKELQDRFLDIDANPKALCVEIEKELYANAQKSLTKRLWEEVAVEAMKWVDILANLQKKPNPYKHGYKAYDFTGSARAMLSIDRKRDLDHSDLFPIVNFLIAKLERTWTPNFKAWLKNNERKFLDDLEVMLRNREYGILKLDILKTLTEYNGPKN